MLSKMVNNNITWYGGLRRERFLLFMDNKPVNGELYFAGNCSELEVEGLSFIETYCTPKDVSLVCLGSTKGGVSEMVFNDVVNILIFNLLISMWLLLSESMTRDSNSSDTIFCLSICR